MLSMAEDRPNDQQGVGWTGGDQAWTKSSIQLPPLRLWHRATVGFGRENVTQHKRDLGEARGLRIMRTS